MPDQLESQRGAKSASSASSASLRVRRQLDNRLPLAVSCGFKVGAKVPSRRVGIYSWRVAAETSYCRTLEYVDRYDRRRTVWQAVGNAGSWSGRWELARLGCLRMASKLRCTHSASISEGFWQGPRCTRVTARHPRPKRRALERQGAAGAVGSFAGCRHQRVLVLLSSTLSRPVLSRV